MIHEELRTETVELVVVLHSLEPIVRLHRRQPVLAGAPALDDSDRLPMHRETLCA